MRIHPAPQNTDEWEYARLGLPTASRFDSLLTPKKMELSRAADGYITELLAEWAIGAPLDDASSGFMQRGHDLEPEAARAYEFLRDCTAAEVGLCLSDDGRFGASPDRLIGDDGLLEVKCPAAKTHVGYLLNPGSLAADYRAQVQGQLWVTGRAWCDIVSYNPSLPAVIERVEPDAAYIAALSAAMADFLARLDAGRERLRALGIEPPPPPEPEPEPDWSLPPVLSGDEVRRQREAAGLSTVGDLSDMKF